MKSQTSRKAIAHRLSSGQAIAEGMAFLVLLTPLIIGTVLLLGNVGLSVFYKEKLISVTNSCSFYAAVRLGQHQELDKVKSATEKVVNDSLKEMGLPAASKIELKATPASNPELVTLTVEVGGLHLMGKNNLFPDVIRLSDRSTVPITEIAPYPNKVISLYLNRPGQGAITLAGFEPATARFPNGYYTQGASIAQRLGGDQTSVQNPDSYYNKDKYGYE